MITRSKKESLYLSISLLIGLLTCFYVFFHGVFRKENAPDSFLLIEMILATLLLFVPLWIEKLFKLMLPSKLTFLYWLFMILSAFLGTGLKLMSTLTYYDKFLHLISAAILTMFGYGLLGYFLRNYPQIRLSSWFYLVYGFVFGLACGVVWEFYEFSCDSLLGMNLQRFSAHGHDLLGRAALMDTMGDLWIDALGSLLFAFFVFLQTRTDCSFVARYAILPATQGGYEMVRETN